MVKDINDDVVNYNLEFGRILANPSPGEDVVISGVAGAFPNSQNVTEFKDNLFNKANMVLPTKRWNLKHPEIPNCSGNIPVINKYDAGFFGIQEKQCHVLDTMMRLFYEKTLEAIMDAGLHPSDLEGSNTGIFVGSCFSENEKYRFKDCLEPNVNAWTCTAKSMLAHRLSYFLKLKGPSFNIDTACSSSLYALEHAYLALRRGEIDSAIVGGTHLCLHPFVSLQFARMGVLSHDGSCKAFDKAGNGYARSETVGALFLQRSKDAKRIYASIVHGKTSCDGYKEQGITYPSGSAQRNLLTEFYQECQVDPEDISYLEAHGTGTVVGDPEECGAIDDVLAKARKTPLLIGSVKSNIGHTEPSSGICSIIKCIIGMENGMIPPTIHYNTPRDEILGLKEGRMVVVTESNTPVDDKGLLGVNSFGFGGGNCHFLLKWNEFKKKSNCEPKDGIPRLVCVSGRTEESIHSLLNSVIENKLNAEYIKLLHEVFRKNINNHLIRGFLIASKSGEIERSLLFSPVKKERSVKLFFGYLEHWIEIGSDLMVLPVFLESMQKFQDKLIHKNVDVVDLFLKKTQTQDGPSNLILGSVAVQISIINILKLLQIKVEEIFGYSLCELLSAYNDDILNLEETANLAYFINEAITKVQLETKSNFIDDQVASEDSIMKRLELLKNSKSIKAKLVQNMKKVISISAINNRKQQSKSVFKHKSVDCFLNAIIQDNSGHITVSSNEDILEIGCTSLQQKLNESALLTLFASRSKDYVVDFLKLIGNLYERGHTPQLGNIYPNVQFPVSRGTPMIAPYIKWKHDREWFVPLVNFGMTMTNQNFREIREFSVQLSDQNWKFVEGHEIDGRCLFPATGYLYLVWETLSIRQNLPMSMMHVKFDNCKFIRATGVPKKGLVQFFIGIERGSGKFEIVEGDTVVVTGRIFLLDSNESHSYYPKTSKSDVLTLNSKDFYKELRLRGYNYKGGFRAVQKSDVTGSRGIIKWDDNWITFMDNMLQLKIIQTDTRSLYVPTFLSEMYINAKQHLGWVNEEYISKNRASDLFVVNDNTTGIISCGGIQIHGLLANSINRKKNLGVPVVERYLFIPNETSLETEQSLRVNLQIILENSLLYKVKAVEVVDEYTKDEMFLASTIKTLLEDLPLIQPEIKISSANPIEIETELEIEVDDKKLGTKNDFLLLVASECIERESFLKEIYVALRDNGYVISRETKDFIRPKHNVEDFTILTVHKTPNETLVLLQKKNKIPTKEYKTIEISSSSDFSWIKQLQNTIKTSFTEDLVLYADVDANNGILGLVNCFRREPDTNKIRCVFIMDKNKRFNVNDPLCCDQLKKNLAMNVYKNGEWGTYRHLLLGSSSEIQTEHCYANITVRGDLSSLTWIEGNLSHNMKIPPERKLIDVYYAALNFRDVMTASGKISSDVITQNRLDGDCVQGFEFSGKDSSGKRIMGMINHGALSTMILADNYLCFDVPDLWTLEEAATIPVVYGTVIYALNIRANIKKGETILIHSGTGGIGLAAIRLALHHGCIVFTTVGSQDKKDFLKKTFPQLKDRYIGNSRNLTFEQMIQTETHGKGVDIVLNSLADDKLVASVRCLAKGGRFLEIGKFDLITNNHLSTLMFQKEASFHGVFMDQLFSETPCIKKYITDILSNGIKQGAVKPLNRNIFKFDEVEKAFRFMAAGKHMGKILIEIRKPEEDLTISAPQKFPAIPRYFCDPKKTYIITGGLGGFGLELCDWLIIRGARKVVLTSRKGISTGYQRLRTSLWKSYGVTLKISTADIATLSGCQQLLEEAERMGPVHAIFNLAVVLADAIFENQSSSSFLTSFGPKAIATSNLDKLSRTLCLELRDFVVFSSASCGRGNAGQSNYGMANSVMERICEQRKLEGYPALAIEWGAIGDVGLVAEMLEEHTVLEISGTLQQSIASCLNVLNDLLKCNHATIVSSMIVAEKKRRAGAANDIVAAVINILGVNDVKSVSMHSTLAELGMDSMTAVEIKQTLEREFEVFLNAKDIRTMTLAKLKQIQEEKDNDGKAESYNMRPFGLEMVFKIFGEESESKVTEIQLKSKAEPDCAARSILLFPGIEGFVKVFEPVAKELEANVFGFQFVYNQKIESIMDIVDQLLPNVKQHVSKNEDFNIVAFSYGSLIALEIVNILEGEGYTGKVILLDGSHNLMKELLNNVDIESDSLFQTTIICHVMSLNVPYDVVNKYKLDIFKRPTFDEKITYSLEVCKEYIIHSEEYLREIAHTIYDRIKALQKYTPSYKTLKAKAKLFKPTQPNVLTLPEDYGLSEVFENLLEIKTFEGNHLTFIEDVSLAKYVNNFFMEGN